MTEQSWLEAARRHFTGPGAIASAFALGNDGFDVNQVRVGASVRF